MSRKKFKRLTALALCVAMCLTAAPVYAEEDSGTAQPETHQEIVTEEMEGQDGQQAQNGDVSENGESQSGQTGEAQDTEQGTTGDQTGTTQPEETVPEETAPEESAPEQPDNGLEPSAESQEPETASEPEVQFEEGETTVPHVFYQSQIQTDGWQKEVQDGATSGTVGNSKRMESIKIRLEDQPYEGDVEYHSHVQRKGWEKVWAKNGDLSGTVGESLRLEAIQIRLTGEMAEHYDIYYRVHAQQYGWLGWAKNGESAGTAAFSYRLEGIQIVLVEKGGQAPGSTDHAFWQRPTVNYQSHVQSIGWQNEVQNGAVSGTVGQSKRMESIKIRLTDQLYSGNIEYRSHIQQLGWESSWKANGALSGTSGRSLRLEAVQIRLTGELAQYFDVYYRVHAQ